MVRGLSVLDDYLDYPQVFAETKGWLPSQVLEAPLAPDMLSFGDQVAVLCNKVDAHVAELLRRNVPLPHEAERNYPASKARLAEPIRFLDGLLAEDLAGAENHTFELSPRSCVDGSAGPITYSNSSCRISFSTSLQPMTSFRFGCRKICAATSSSTTHRWQPSRSLGLGEIGTNEPAFQSRRATGAAHQ
jgi:hypothetical protein